MTELSTRTLAPARPPADPPVFRRDLQGLRAVAILLIVGTAVGGTGTGGIGLDVFFVISGFVITGPLVREIEQHGQIALRPFYARRTTRMVPACVLIVLGTLAACWHWMPPGARVPVAADALAALTSTMNLRPVDGSSPLGHFWPLAVAGQFYLIWPLLIGFAAARRTRPAMALVLGPVSAASLALYAAGGPSVSLPARLWEFGLGALLALGARRLALLAHPSAALLTWAGLGVIGTAALGYGIPAAVLGTGLVIAGGCARPARGARLLMRTKPLQELGRVSFSWYLWHWPVLVLAPYVLGHPVPVLGRAALVVAALVPAAMSTAAVENRIRLHGRLRAYPGRALALGGALTAAAAGVVLVALMLPVPVVVPPPAPVPAAAALASGDVTLARLQDIIREDSTRTTPAETPALPTAPRDGGCLAPFPVRVVSYQVSRGCERHGDPAGRKIVVLFGDSHAQQWYEPLDALARTRGWRLAVLTKAECTPAEATVGGINRVGAYTECDRWRAQALDRIARLRPALVVMSGRYREASPLDETDTAGADQDWAAAWAATVLRVRRAGAVPVYVQDTPIPPADVPACLAAHPITAGACDLDVLAALSLPRQRVVRAMVQAHGARVVDTTAWFCTPTICPAVVGGTVVYRDDDHVNSAYAAHLAGLLGRQLEG